MKRAAFTLLEVMVAIAILALSLSAIYSSQAGAIKMAHRARKMGLASLLVRCKMGEIEEQVASEGLPAVFDSGSDDCCEDGEIEGFSCDWEIDPIVLPDGMFPAEEGGEPGKEASAMPQPGAEDTASDPMSTLSEIDPSQALSGGGALQGVASMALNLAYPVLKPSFEQQIRRATVTVRWKEGSTDHEFDVTQYLVADQPIAVPDATQPTQPAPGSIPP